MSARDHAPQALNGQYGAMLQEIHEAEQAKEPTRLRAAYTAFLREYPLCFGYWKRLADFEVTVNTVDAANDVYERALVLGRYCVELWVFYGVHATTHWPRPDEVRALFQRGAAVVGSDYGADVFWDRYIAFETARADADHSRVSSVYRRALQLPLRSLDALWLRFQKLAVERSCDEVLDSREEQLLQEQLEAAGLTPQRPEAGEAEDDGARKLRLLPLLEAQFRRAKADHAERLQWEAGVRRRHFHLQPLAEAEVAYWHAYLDWEETRGNTPRLILTYERCLVPCCAEPGLWQRYIRALEGRGLISEARDASARMSGHFFRRRCSVLLEHAAFEEAHANVDEARRLCAAAAALQPPVLDAALARAALERRQGDLDAMWAAYEAACVTFGGEALAFLVSHAARTEHRLRGAPERVTNLIEAAMRREPSSDLLWEIRIEHEVDLLEVQPRSRPPPAEIAADGSFKKPSCGHVTHGVPPAALERLAPLFERALAPGSALSEEAKRGLWRRYLQLVSTYSEDVARVRALREQMRLALSPKRRKLSPTDAADGSQPTDAPAPGGAPVAPYPPPPYPAQQHQQGGEAYAYQSYAYYPYPPNYYSAPQPQYMGPGYYPS